ncbi:MAG: trypsin-like peptidase domain-containing protein [Pseudohongiellaceae bacterium]
MMKKTRLVIGYAAWPVMTGVLLAVVLLQYQQLQELGKLTSQLQSSPPDSLPAAISFSEAIGRAAPSVVSINATSVNVEGIETSQDRIDFLLGERESLGSGVIFRDGGFILTNLHVVQSLQNMFDTVVTLKDGRSSPAKVVAYDRTNDLAVLHINMDDLAPIQIGDDQSLRVGDVVFAIGYPRNIGQSVSQGIVSALDRNQSATSDSYVIQTDAAINPGNSGGALIDRNGRLVGINSSIFTESGRFEGIGFATPVSVAVQAMDDLIAKVIADNPGYLGVLTGEVLNEETSNLFFGRSDIRGMLVENVDDGGAAQRAGILPGDVITAVDETMVINEQTIFMEFQNKHPGDHVTIQVYREGEMLNLETILGFGQAMVIVP